MTARLRRPAVIGVLVSLVMVLAWWQLLWTPQGAAVAAAHRQDVQATSNLVTVEQNVAHLKHLQTISATLASLEQHLSAAAPDSDELDQVLLTLSSLAQAAGISVHTISPGRPAQTTAGGLETMQVQLSGQGDYFAIQSFLDSLRTSTRLIVVDTIAESPAGAKNSDQITLTLAMHLFAGLPPPSAAAQRAETAPTPTTKPPTGVISGPVTKAKNAVNALNARSSQLSSQANATGGP
jgi:Tfp pilus assembly protein PilO